MEKIQNSTGLPRRDFIKRTATAAAAVAATPLLKTPVCGQSEAPSANVTGANNRIAVAVIGIGVGIGQNHLSGIHSKAGENNTVMAAACDLFSKRRNWAKEQAGLKDSDLFTDHRKLLEMIDKRLSRLSDALGDKAYVDSDRFTAGDLMMTTVLRIIDGKGLLDGYSNLVAYKLRCQERPAFQAALAAQLADFEERGPVSA